ncbi:MAG: hypothetical protein ACI92E_001619, partial [Oceanicoccus sp.]
YCREIAGFAGNLSVGQCRRRAMPLLKAMLSKRPVVYNS